MTVVGKDIAKAFYGEAPKHSYYTGCSTGGQQGLIEAQYYPDDYDGVLIGAPVVSRTWGHAAVAWDYIAANLEPGHKLSDAKLTLLNKSAIAACNAKSDGLKSDPFIADPAACDFDPATLTCQGADSADCLTAAEVETAKAFYSGPKDHSGKTTYYGWPPGSELARSTGPFSRRRPTRPASRRSTACSNGCSAPTGTGAISISIGTCPKSTRSSGRSSMARRPGI